MKFVIVGMMLLVAGCGTGRAHVSNPTAAQQPGSGNHLNLSAVAAAAREADWGRPDALEKLGLNASGYNWVRQFTLGSAGSGQSAPVGPPLTGVILSRQYDGTLLVFHSESGELLSRTELQGEPVSFELFDFDGDGLHELITSQLTGYGTGVRREEFVIYAFSPHDQPAEVFRETGLSMAWFHPDQEPEEYEEGFVRPSYRHLVYVRVGRNGDTTVRKELEYLDGKFVESAKPN